MTFARYGKPGIRAPGGDPTTKDGTAPAGRETVQHQEANAMKYARAAWRIFLAWAARKLRFPQQLVWDLEDQATLRMFACTLDFEPAQVTTRPPTPTGWRCKHFSISSTGGSVTQPSTGCGCTPEPVYS